MANKKYSFQNKRKLFVSMFVFAFVAIAVAAAVVTVFALSQTNVTSSVRITYKAVGVVGKVEMYAKKGAEVESKIGEVEFAIDTTDTDDFSLVDKEL